MFAKDGVRGFYRGVLPNVARALPEASIQFAAYEAIKGLLGVGQL